MRAASMILAPISCATSATESPMASRGRTPKGRAASRVGMRGRNAPYLSREALRALGGISEDQLRVWEFEELITRAAVIEVDGEPVPVYTHATLRRIRTIRSLGEDLGVNLPGIGVILHLLDRTTSFVKSK
jgi:MerR HTH family regulatory protein